jgi:predicted transcriptional regulator
MPLAAILAVAGVALLVAVSAAWVGLRKSRDEVTSELVEHGLHGMSLQEADIFRVIKERKEFTIVYLMHETGASKTIARRTIQKLIKKGLVQPTEKTIEPVAGRGKPSTVYKYVGD